MHKSDESVDMQCSLNAINDPCIFMKTQDTDIFLHVICLSLLESIAGLDDTERGG